MSQRVRTTKDKGNCCHCLASRKLYGKDGLVRLHGHRDDPCPAQTVHHLGHVMQMGLPRYSRPLMDRTGLAVKIGRVETVWLGYPIQWRWGLMVRVCRIHRAWGPY